ncbi:LysR family transcriptional regulator [Achromobacter sp. K91]|uniref:LysR family transcriptional regulator n=1 Tax=Achromobacter sp. K91 TaxID=2292262 RepID=UPI000E66160A|nr:LysR family transcriptional regulator [Achromobacter sp. K91]RIJ03239.1 LysR family transcriptional regulator [Achromobacter sp. K91]
MSFDIRPLRCFVVAATTGSVSKAGEVLHLAQPAVSLQIKGLEERLNVQLLYRTARGVQPTEAGLRLLEHGREILNRIDIAWEDVREAARNPSGTVTIGLPQSIAIRLTVPLLSAALQRWPDVRLRVSEQSSGYIAGQLVAGELDIGITYQFDESLGLFTQHVMDEDLVLVGPSGALSTAGAESGLILRNVMLEELVGYPLFLPDPRHGARMLLDQYFSKYQVKVDIRAEVNVLSQLIQLAARGLGYTIVARSSVMLELKRGEISAANIIAPKVERPIFISRVAGKPPTIAAAAAFDLIVSMLRLGLGES